MMSNQVNRILKRYSINEIQGNDFSLEWRTQDSKPSSILFYTFKSFDQSQIDLYKKRIEKSEYKICLTNLESSEAPGYHLGAENFNKIQNELTDLIYPFDFTKVKLIGITGTNGKTTTVDIIRQICLQNDLGVLTIGTLGVFENDKCVDDFSLTTPALMDFRKVIHSNGQNCQVIAFEISSHALDQKRLGMLELDAAGWTNFTQDHLDYHLSMDEYFLAKKKIIKLLKKSASLFVSKKQEGLISKLNDPKVKASQSNFYPEHAFFKAKYNQENFDVAYSLLKDLGFKLTRFNINPPAGRFNIIEHGHSFVIIDYAHTPDALKNICRELTTSFINYNFIVLFGCGGDRDKSKREIMGSIASKYADKIYVTSDNSRFEEPTAIIDDILRGIDIDKYEVIINRSDAIKKAMQENKKSVILIAGKGHENYIDFNGEKIPYSDIGEVKKWIKNVNN